MHKGPTLKIRYALSSQAWLGLTGTLQRLATRPGVKRICEIGGGANPALALGFVQAHGLDYTLLDVSATELAKAPDGYSKIQADIAAPDLPAFGGAGGYDLVFSRMTAEHVCDGCAFHRNVWNLLAEPGMAFHFFPTLYALPFACNWLLPAGWADQVLHFLQPHRTTNGRHDKFAAYYSWCRGPSAGQIRRFERLGFEVDEYIGFFGHSGSATAGPGYFDRFPPVRAVHERLSGWLVRRPVPWLTSFAYVILSKKVAPRRPARAAHAGVCG